MADKPLDTMTVKELKEIAKEIPDLTGIHSMKKDELLTAITKAKGGAAVKEKKAKAAPAAKTPAKSPAKKKAKKAAPKLKSLSPTELKKIITDLREEKLAAQQAKDKKQIKILRKKINRMKKMTRKPEAQQAKPKVQPKKQPQAEAEVQAEA